MTRMLLAALGLFSIFAAPTLAQNMNVPARPTPANDPGTWIGTDDYPPTALESRAQGAVGFTLTVGATGNVTDCKIVSSSGSQILDDQTCTLLRERARSTKRRPSHHAPFPHA